MPPNPLETAGAGTDYRTAVPPLTWPPASQEQALARPLGQRRAIGRLEWGNATWVRIGWMGAVLLMASFCFLGRSAVLLFLDEYHSLSGLQQTYGYLLTHFDTRGSGLALPVLQKLASDLLGKQLWVYRLPSGLAAVAAIGLFYPVARRLVGRTAAIIALAAICTHPLAIYYARLGRSYAPAMCLGILFAYAHIRSLRQGAIGRSTWALLTISGGLLPWVHLSTGGYALGISLSALAIGRKQPRRVRRMRMLALLGGASIAIALHAPAMQQVLAFVGESIPAQRSEVNHDQRFLSETLLILAGGRPAQLAWLLLLIPAVIWLLRERRDEAWLLIAGPLAMVLLLVVVSPRGSPAAYARYLLVTLPFVLMILSWLLVRIVRKVFAHSNRSNGIAVVLGLGLVGGALASGPLGANPWDGGPFANGYSALWSQPKHDLPWKETPPFYRMLTRLPSTLRILEAPEIKNRRSALYRNYQRLHGNAVLFGTLDAPGSRDYLPRELYVPLVDREAIRSSGAQFLVLHLDVLAECDDYWRSVNEEDPARGVSYETRTRIESLPELSGHVPALTRRLGAPTYRDRRIVVWQLEPVPGWPLVRD